MSEICEQSVEELYGDTWTREDKDAEIARLKAEQGIIDMDEPAVNLDGLSGEEDQVAGNEGGAQDGNSGDREQGVSDDGQAGPSTSGTGE